ncbi:hypothetical protein niasHS_002738 [Heterodera schachtii]|uniref:Uncharacterized protein n=1 Tax=Heterodera schachtii TaxID=97005 RepID=A0ABD2K2B7_HETSC
MSFFNRQPDLFNTKKLGTGHGSGSNLAAAGLAFGPPTSAPTLPSATDDTDSVQENQVESWVELAPSRASLCSSIEAVMLDSASGGENSVTRDSRLSPVSLQSPHVEFETSLEQVKYRLVKDILPFADGAKPSDWLWDWSARSETGNAAQKSGAKSKNCGAQIGSTLTTPPNSPEPESSEFEFKSKSSNRSILKKTASRKSVFLRFDVIFGFVFSNLVTFFLGAAIGYCICRKVWKAHDNYEERALSYYFN